MHFFLSWQFLCRQCNFQKSKRWGKFQRSFNTWKHRTISAYSNTLNPHISDMFKAQLVVHWSAIPTFLSTSLSVLIHCSVNQLWSEYFYSSPSCARFIAWIKSVLSISTFTHQGAEQSGGCHGSLPSSALLSRVWTPSLFHFKPSLSPSVYRSLSYELC